jgi:hypothetical protein
VPHNTIAGVMTSAPARSPIHHVVHIDLTSDQSAYPAKFKLPTPTVALMTVLGTKQRIWPRQQGYRMCSDRQTRSPEVRARDKPTVSPSGRSFATSTRATGARLKLCQAQAVGRFPATATQRRVLHSAARLEPALRERLGSWSAYRMELGQRHGD